MSCVLVCACTGVCVYTGVLCVYIGEGYQSLSGTRLERTEVRSQSGSQRYVYMYAYTSWSVSSVINIGGGDINTERCAVTEMLWLQL